MRKNPNVSQILQQVHTMMVNKYTISQNTAVEQYKAQAQVLQNFLQILKKRAFLRKNTDSLATLQEDIYDLILDNIVLPNGRTLYNLFRRTSSINKITGQYFEDDLAAVIASVINLASGKSGRARSTYKTYSFGNIAGTTDVSKLSTMIDDIANDVTSAAAETCGTELKKDKTGFVLGKIDTMVQDKIVNLNGSINFPDGLLEALSQATFTDKSYRSKGWDKRLGKEISLGEKTIHLGNSNSYRAVLGSMASLGFDKSTTDYVYYAGQNIVAGLDTDEPIEDINYVKQHIYHLRYLYELTGVGILYKDYGANFAEGAKFLVYNDPNSEEIIVVSTAQIIAQLLNSSDFPDNPYGSAIGVKKNTLRSF